MSTTPARCSSEHVDVRQRAQSVVQVRASAHPHELLADPGTQPGERHAGQPARTGDRAGALDPRQHPRRRRQLRHPPLCGVDLADHRVLVEHGLGSGVVYVAVPEVGIQLPAPPGRPRTGKVSRVAGRGDDVEPASATHAVGRQRAHLVPGQGVVGELQGGGRRPRRRRDHALVADRDHDRGVVGPARADVGAHHARRDQRGGRGATLFPLPLLAALHGVARDERGAGQVVEQEVEQGIGVALGRGHLVEAGPKARGRPQADQRGERRHLGGRLERQQAAARTLDAGAQRRRAEDLGRAVAPGAQVPGPRLDEHVGTQSEGSCRVDARCPPDRARAARRGVGHRVVWPRGLGKQHQGDTPTGRSRRPDREPVGRPSRVATTPLTALITTPVASVTRRRQPPG